VRRCAALSAGGPGAQIFMLKALEDAKVA